MSFQAMAWVVGVDCGGPTGKAIMYTLANYANEDGEAYPSISTISAQLGMSRRSVQNWLTKLEGMGVVAKTGRTRVNGSITSNVYTLAIAKFAPPYSKVCTPPIAKFAPPEPITNNLSLDTISPIAPLSENHDEVKAAFEMWNETAAELNLPACQKVSQTRSAAMKARLHDCGGLEGWETMLSKVVASDFLSGRNGKGWSAKIDWVLKPANFIKIMEGNYDDNGKNDGPRGGGKGSSVAQAVRNASKLIDDGINLSTF